VALGRRPYRWSCRLVSDEVAREGDSALPILRGTAWWGPDERNAGGDGILLGITPHGSSARPLPATAVDGRLGATPTRFVACGPGAMRGLFGTRRFKARRMSGHAPMPPAPSR
jgi:hypothetical protein